MVFIRWTRYLLLSLAMKKTNFPNFHFLSSSKTDYIEYHAGPNFHNYIALFAFSLLCLLISAYQC